MAAGKPMRVALTGGIASGKSTVADLFTGLDVPVIDTDLIARELLAPGTPWQAQVIERFGSAVRAVDGSLDRRALRELVFADAPARAALESLLHPAIRARAAEREAAARGPYLITVIPLLAETGRAGDYNRVLLVDCDERAQRARLAQRDGSSDASIDAALSAQASRAQRRALAHDVIANDGALALLTPRVHQLHAQYLDLAHRP
jgi:dephospho-CoA kinase